MVKFLAKMSVADRFAYTFLFLLVGFNRILGIGQVRIGAG
jgi:hypothetical protein